MGDPVSLSIVGIGAVAINEGIKFLYAQAGEILKRWRARQDKTQKAAHHTTSSAEHNASPTLDLPAIFEGQLVNPSIHFDVVQESEPELRRLYKELSEYANDVEPVDEANVDLLGKVDALRQILEQIYQQHITFRGENRPASGTLLVGKVKAKSIAGEATGVDAEGELSGEIRGEVEADRIEHGSKTTGVRWKSKPSG